MTWLSLHRLISTGHSLGGALASLNAAWWYDVQLPYLGAKVQPCPCILTVRMVVLAFHVDDMTASMCLWTHPSKALSPGMCSPHPDCAAGPRQPDHSWRTTGV